MTERPFVQDEAFANVKQVLYHDDVCKILFKLIDKKGVINLGGKSQYSFNFAKKDKKNVKTYLKKNSKLGMPFDSSMNLRKLKLCLGQKN